MNIPEHPREAQAMDAFMTLDCRRDFLLHFEVLRV